MATLIEVGIGSALAGAFITALIMRAHAVKRDARGRFIK